MRIKVYVIKGVVSVVYAGTKTTYPKGYSISQAVEQTLGLYV